jgi:chromosome segregation ATPase
MNQIIEATIDGEIINLNDFSKPETLNVTDAAILELEKKHRGLKVSDNKELKTATAARKEVRDLRIAVQNRNKDLKKSLNNAKKSIDAEADRIITKLQAIESPLDTEIKNYQEEQERIKREEREKEAKRVADIQQRIDAFYNNAKNLHGKTAAELLEKLELFTDCVNSDTFDYQEFSIQAQKAKDEVMVELHNAHKIKKEQEEEAARIAEERKKIEEEKAELERQRQELAEQAREKAVFDTEESDAELVEKITQANSGTLFEDLKEGLEEAIEYNNGKDTGAYSLNKSEAPTPVEDVVGILKGCEHETTTYKSLEDLKRKFEDKPESTNDSDAKIIVHKKIMDALLKEGVEYNQAGEFLKLLQANLIPHVTINYGE